MLVCMYVCVSVCRYKCVYNNIETKRPADIRQSFSTCGIKKKRSKTTNLHCKPEVIQLAHKRNQKETETSDEQLECTTMQIN